jgi:hypothetical protein
MDALGREKIPWILSDCCKTPRKIRRNSHPTIDLPHMGSGP